MIYVWKRLLEKPRRPSKFWAGGQGCIRTGKMRPRYSVKIPKFSLPWQQGSVWVKFYFRTPNMQLGLHVLFTDVSSLSSDSSSESMNWKKCSSVPSCSTITATGRPPCNPVLMSSLANCILSNWLSSITGTTKYKHKLVYFGPHMQQ